MQTAPWFSIKTSIKIQVPVMQQHSGSQQQRHYPLARSGTASYAPRLHLLLNKQKLLLQVKRRPQRVPCLLLIQLLTAEQHRFCQSASSPLRSRPRRRPPLQPLGIQPTIRLFVHLCHPQICPLSLPLKHQPKCHRCHQRASRPLQIPQPIQPLTDQRDPEKPEIPQNSQPLRRLWNLHWSPHCIPLSLQPLLSHRNLRRFPPTIQVLHHQQVLQRTQSLSRRIKAKMETLTTNLCRATTQTPTTKICTLCRQSLSELSVCCLRCVYSVQPCFSLSVLRQNEGRQTLSGSSNCRRF